MRRRNHIAYVHLTPSSTPAVLVHHGTAWTATGLEAPHRHAYHEVLWFQAGSGTHIIDGKRIAIEPYTVALIAQGQVHTFVQTRNLSVYTLRFTDDFFGSESVLYDPSYRLLCNYFQPNQRLVIPPAERERGDALLHLLIAEYEQAQQNGVYNVVRHLLRAFLFQIERIHRSTQREHIHNTLGQEQVYWNFVHLLEQHFHHQHGVAFYAQALCHSTEQLTNVLQHVLGKTTKRVIIDRVILEARRKLQFTDTSVKEVATSLGFSDPFHFSKLFKQEAGLSPQEYRKQRWAIPDESAS